MPTPQDTRITGLDVGTVIHPDDWLVFVDTHDTTMAPSGTDKKAAPGTLLAGLGAGTVTSVSVVASGGVSGTVANPTTTPAITLTLGAITPASVSASGAVSGSNLSGTNTGDQANITGTAGGLSAPIAESQVTGLTSDLATLTTAVAAKGTGSVTSVSVASANGLGGTVATATTTPAITLTTSVAGMVKGNGTALAAAVAGTDYVIPSGSIAGTAGGLSSPIAEGQVTNLTSDLATLTTAVSARLVAASNLSDLASATAARSNLGLGPLATLSALPNPSSSTLGGIQSTTGAAHQWVASISTAGVPALSQPAFADISGTAAVAQGGTGASGLTAYAVLCGGTTSTGAVQPLASPGAAGTVLTSNGASALPSFQPAPYAFVNVTTATQSMAVNTGYVTNCSSSYVTYTLPATASVGQRLAVVGSSSGGWYIAQGSGQTIHFGPSATTAGAGGYLGWAVRYDCVELICVVANTDWAVMTSVGNLVVN